MVRCVVSAVVLLLAGAALAQEGVSPPVVSSEAPVLEGAAPETETPPTLPGAAVGPAGTAETDGTPAPTSASMLDAGPDTTVAIETDLASIVLKAHPVVQAVMAALGLAVAAVLTVFLFKVVEFALAFTRLRRARARITAGAGLVALPGACPLALTSQAVVDEAAHLPSVLTADLRASARDRLELRL
ncbi:MAG: hypothetical protein EON48_16115, partial [Acetobacteraceae bacterium]